MLRWSVEEDRKRKLEVLQVLLLGFGKGRKMWNEDNKEGNQLLLEIKADGIRRKECMDWEWFLTSSLKVYRREKRT
jgi:hypothetical protein